ncbi:Protein of unknown function (DUF1365) [Fragilaria crotonensis]|nr:Protein of unknown function (DUF1365) [Fragilaria crotonensis]
MSFLTILLFTIAASLLLLVGGYVVLVIVTAFLAVATTWRSKYRTSKSRLLIGRVSHSRKIPAIHGFSYPIFMALVDLEQNFEESLYPLSLVAQLCDEDHYKNNEGGGEGSTTSLTLAERTLRLVAEKTNDKFQPTLETHSVKLLTHLRYYGYCFNPVSFYYILRRDSMDHKIDTIVAEVSNTPWNEMQCYVLHPDSIDIMKVVQPSQLQVSGKNQIPGINYVFRKAFHVSPFMDMDQVYDWTFWELPLDMVSLQEQHPIQQPSSSASSMSSSSLRISTSVFQNEELYFNAYLQLKNGGWHPYNIAFQLVKFPLFCVILQIWIHLQAFAIFFKGVKYVPHPEGSETAASALIGRAMAPIFALKDWWDAKKSTNKTKNH